MDVEMHLESMGLGETIVRGNSATNHSRAKAVIFLRHHIDEGLKMEYLTVKNPLDLWNKLKERYDHLKLIVLPKARSDWHNLRLQDFKSVTEYNSAIFRITSQLNLCGENITDGDMMEKTFSTFHASNVILQQQYRDRGFRTYSDLITCLLLAEQNSELLLKIHASRPTGSSPFPEANTVEFANPGRRNNNGRRNDRGQRRDRPQPRRNNGKRPYKPLKWQNDEHKKNYEDKCHRCAQKDTSRESAERLSNNDDAYDDVLKNTSADVNLAKQNNDDTYDDVLNSDLMHLDTADFLEHPEGAK
ncbi:uncharacterized protein LOC127264807 [Andrographis paniculata]|uniref:uncharacterized protein LOC127264807 n=1 Tax=Andrographis paniculata TaxID=175694 RepID=UPI0021E7D062|nr:uncharacterized protein LOC127264807 [Andrographis paniculata]